MISLKAFLILVLIHYVSSTIYNFCNPCNGKKKSTEQHPIPPNFVSRAPTKDDFIQAIGELKSFVRKKNEVLNITTPMTRPPKCKQYLANTLFKGMIIEKTCKGSYALHVYQKIMAISITLQNAARDDTFEFSSNINSSIHKILCYAKRLHKNQTRNNSFSVLSVLPQSRCKLNHDKTISQTETPQKRILVAQCCLRNTDAMLEDMLNLLTSCTGRCNMYNICKRHSKNKRKNKRECKKLKCKRKRRKAKNKRGKGKKRRRLKHGKGRKKRRSKHRKGRKRRKNMLKHTG